VAVCTSPPGSQGRVLPADAASILQLGENAALELEWTAEKETSPRRYMDTLRFKYDKARMTP